jgi:ABC-type metal ion transport system substrate-binding protein
LFNKHAATTGAAEMTKFIVREDGKKSEATEVEARNTAEALDIAAVDVLNSTYDVLNIIEAENLGAREFYGV